MVLFLLLCAASAYGFDDLLRAQEPRTVNAEICRNVSAVFLLACLLMGVNNLLLFDTLSVGRALSVLILLILSGTGGALCGASAGLILGIAMDVAAGAGVLFSVIYAAAGLLSGQFCKHRRGFYLLVFAAAYLLTLFCIPLPELRIGAGVELVLAVGAYRDHTEEVRDSGRRFFAAAARRERGVRSAPLCRGARRRRGARVSAAA